MYVYSHRFHGGNEYLTAIYEEPLFVASEPLDPLPRSMVQVSDAFGLHRVPLHLQDTKLPLYER